MDLKTYFETRSVNKSEFARRSGVPLRTLYNLLSGKFKVSLETAVKIEKATLGEVRCAEMLRSID